MVIPSKDQWIAMGWTALRTFFVTAIGAILAFGIGIFDLAASDWKGVLASGISAVLMVVLQFLNPGNDKYGVGYLPQVAPEIEEAAAPAVVKPKTTRTKK